MNERAPGVVRRGHNARLSLREHCDWRELSRTRRESVAARQCAPPVRFEIERVNRHGIVGYHLVWSQTAAPASIKPPRANR